VPKWKTISLSAPMEEVEELDRLAERVGWSRSLLLRFAARWLLRQVREGKVRLEDWETSVKRPRLP